MEHITELVTIILAVLFIGSLIFNELYFTRKAAKRKKEQEVIEELSKASLTEEGTPVEEAFDNLSKEDVDIGYLKKSETGENDEQDTNI